MSEMVVIPNTPTLVAEQNIERPRATAPAPPPAPAAPAAPRASKREQHSKRDKLPTVGEVIINERNEPIMLKTKLGDGAMGHVFLATYDGEAVAVKTEKYSTAMLPMELRVLSIAQREKCKHFCRIYDYGTVRKEFNYMIITLLYKDLYRLRSEMANRSFSLNTSTKIALDTLEAIEELHSIGFLSRDVKPSNFAPGEQQKHKTIFMFDFGLAKKFVDRENRKLKSRGEVGWRGTVRYGSLNAHKRLDLGRRDDIECWFYMLIEMYVSELPWRFLTERAAVGKAKEHVRAEGRKNFFHNVPKQFETILNMIDGYQFETRPDYKAIKRLIQEVRNENGLTDRVKWDWQTDESQHSELTETTSVMSDNAILAEEGTINLTETAKQRCSITGEKLARADEEAVGHEGGKDRVHRDNSEAG
ncbi:unnamed protein product [Caenorhabditis bovis]|uniref:Protein kinase domain-containing protein n=1 Tax=Caenorhabditis bovis TaxID=2654633 RepID=A0A8S1EWT1_9PELO|nr:unnamed protein product [Caenorhabditis bovis]